MSQSSRGSAEASRGDDGGLTHIEDWSCHCCGDPDHTIFDCPVAEERREDRREPEAALRLDPVVRGPEE